MFFFLQLILNFLEEVVQKPTVLIGNSVGSLACVIAASGLVLIFDVIYCLLFFWSKTPLFVVTSWKLEESQRDLVRGLVLLNCAGGMNNKAVFDDWRIKLLMPLLLLIDFLLKQRGIASALFNRVKDRHDSFNNLFDLHSS